MQQQSQSLSDGDAGASGADRELSPLPEKAALRELVAAAVVADLIDKVYH